MVVGKGLGGWEYLKGYSEAVAVAVGSDGPFESGSVTGQFNIVGEGARILKDGLRAARYNNGDACSACKES